MPNLRYPVKATKRSIAALLRRLGIEARLISAGDHAMRYGHDCDDATRRIVDRCLPYTMTSPLALVSVVQAIRHLEDRQIAGDIVECGVYRGGSMMAAALALQQYPQSTRRLWLYDTFEGFVDGASEADGSDAAQWVRQQHRFWDVDSFSIERVRANVLSTNFPADRLALIQGRVEETIPRQVPERIAMLRLDTDMYASTRHELEHLYPLLSDEGVLIIDDYGCPRWPGSRQATTEYFAGTSRPPFLFRIDQNARMVVKRAA